MLSEKRNIMESRNPTPVDPQSIFVGFAIAKLRQQTERIQQVLPLLSDEAFAAAPNAACNSVGQLLVHLAGNLRQWVLHGIRGDRDERDRDAEFAWNGEGGSRAEVEAHFAATVAEACDFLSHLEADRWTAKICPQGYEVSVLEAIFHVTEHFSYHAGQIFLLVKIHSSKDLAFYRHLDKSNKTHTETIP